MIEITPTTAFVLYLAMTLATLSGFWIYQHVHFRRKVIRTAAEYLFLCEYCQNAYIQDSSKEVTQCPNCLSYNKNNRYRATKASDTPSETITTKTT